jgi:phasin family protein
MAQKKTAEAAAPRAAGKTEAQLALVHPTADQAATEPKSATPAAKPAKAKAKAKAVKRAAPVKAPNAKPAAATPLAAFDDFTAAGGDAIEAYLTCSKIAAEGVESLGKEVVGFAQASVEAQFAYAKTMMDAKTFQDAFEAHSDYTAKNIDHLTAQATKLTQMSVKLASEIMEPIQARVEVATQTWLKPLAA